MNKILFVASLHHPEVLQRERASNASTPLFPSSNSIRFWENAFRKRGYTLDVFYRNLPSRARGDISQLKAEKFTSRITPQRIAQAAISRLPYRLNFELRQRNANLIEQARRFQPEVIWMVGDNTVIHAETVAQLKVELGCKILYSTGTSPIVFSRPIEREAASLYDLVIVNDYYHGIQWLELGAKDMLCLPVVAIDPDFHSPRPINSAYACDISFVGTLLPANLYSERVAALEALREFDLGIWSVHEIPDNLKRHLRGAALGESMLEVLSSSKITLNPHGNFMRYGGNMRLFEAAALGTFQLVDNRPGIHEWFKDGEHLVIYTDKQDLREKAAYYLAHPAERQAIADAAKAHVLAHHTYEQRLDKLENANFFRTSHPKNS
jgi:spore maturation protein CgeB